MNNNNNNNNNKVKRVGIIGAGPCGIVSGKIASIECGFEVVLFDKNESIGGVWSIGDGGKAWDNMKTHISYVSMMFSDYFWNVPEEKKPFHPTREEMYQYYIDYCNHFNLLNKIKLKTKVLQVTQQQSTDRDNDDDDDDKKWIVKWCNIDDCDDDDENNPKNIKQDIFDFIIISTGLFSKKKRND